MPLQGSVNRFVRGLLPALLRCPLAGNRLLVVYLAGRRSGRHYAVPVAYAPINGSLPVGLQFAWLHNLRTGEPVHIRLLDKQRPVDVRMLTEETAVVEHPAIMARNKHQFAKFNKISFDDGGDDDVPGPAT